MTAASCPANIKGEDFQAGRGRAPCKYSMAKVSLDRSSKRKKTRGAEAMWALGKEGGNKVEEAVKGKVRWGPVG